MFRKTLIVACAVAAGGCMMTSTSSGIVANHSAKRLPSNMPREVTLFPFGGNQDLAPIAEGEFVQGLPVLGFEVVERKNLAAIISELHIQQTGFVAADKVAQLGKALGARAIVMGTVKGEASALWVDSHLNLRLIAVETGKVLWSCSAHDPRLFTWSMDPKTSIIHSARHALKLLKRDISTALAKEGGAGSK